MSNPKATVVENKNWLKAECSKCPYLVNGKTIGEGGDGSGMMRCVRPFGERCLAEGMLVQMLLRGEKL